MNNADGVLDVIYKPKVVVTFDGTVLWMPPAGKMCTLQQVRLVPDVSNTIGLGIGIEGLH